MMADGLGLVGVGLGMYICMGNVYGIGRFMNVLCLVLRPWLVEPNRLDSSTLDRQLLCSISFICSIHGRSTKM